MLGSFIGRELEPKDWCSAGAWQDSGGVGRGMWMEAAPPWVTPLRRSPSFSYVRTKLFFQLVYRAALGPCLKGHGAVFLG